MTREELMQLSAEKALRELSWKSIEYLFQPLNHLELFLRLDFEGMRKKIVDWITDNSPDAMPHRFRGPHAQWMLNAIDVERFYRKIKTVKNSQ